MQLFFLEKIKMGNSQETYTTNQSLSAYGLCPKPKKSELQIRVTNQSLSAYGLCPKPKKSEIWG